MANDFALGTNVKLWIEPGTTATASTSSTSGYTFDASSEPYEILAEDIKRQRRTIGGNEIRGTRKSHVIRRRYGHYENFGPIEKYLSPAEVETLSPKFLGAEDTGVFTADEELPYFSVLVQRDSGVFGTASTSIFEYDDAKFSRFRLYGQAAPFGSSAEPEMVRCQLEVISRFQRELSLPGSLPSLGTGATYEPYVFSDTDSGITIAGATRPIQKFQILIDNRMEAKTVNSTDPYAIKANDRVVLVRLTFPWNDAVDDVYDQAKAGAAGSIVLTNGAYSTTFEFGTLSPLEERTPTARRGKQHIELTMDFLAHASAATGNDYDVQITNDVTA